MKPASGNRGMTLVEILAGLIILSILALVTLRYMGVSLTASTNAFSEARDAEAAVSVMERITVDYRRLLGSALTPLTSLHGAIGAEGTHQTNAYGTYEVLSNAFIVFDVAGQETPDSAVFNTLKVKIQVGNRRLVALFTN